MEKDSKRYVIAVWWFVMSLAVSSMNDALQKYLSSNIGFFQVVFFRFFFASVVLLPILLLGGVKSFYTPRIYIHFIRGLFLFVAISLWCYGLTIVPMVTATVLTFTIPLFVLILARIFLKEQVSVPFIIATLLGFSGAVIALDVTHIAFEIKAFVIILAALLFASLDVINKKFVHQETTTSMLFYSALFTAILAFVPMMYNWIDLSWNDYALFFLLGIGGNLILFCLLKAFKKADASALAPYRYLELLLSASLGFFLFSEMPTVMLVAGAAIIIPSTLFIALYKGAAEKDRSK
ncbi:MAG: DMT family transporter [Alphaproteobacteria bacterium]|jgi:S-adenosylmethionine uptake transporter|nr:DMT family transporter [Candidatus Jidaibacter sp.]